MPEDGIESTQPYLSALPPRAWCPSERKIDLLHQELILLFGQSHQIVQFGQIDREWFLAQYGFSSIQSSLGIFIMKVVGCADIDRIYLLDYQHDQKLE